MPNIEDIDVNFKVKQADDNGIVYYSCLEEPFKVHGLYKPKETGKFMRLPESLSKDTSINGGVRNLMFNTSGGRVRFVTNSRSIHLRVKLGLPVCLMSHMPNTGIHGFDMYVSSVDKLSKPLYKKTFVPNNTNPDQGDYSGSHEFDDDNLREITINFPLYNRLDALEIGLCEGCTIEAPSSYSTELPMVFYGSSVTQGGCASRPGTNYTNLLSRWLDADFINLGFSGCDRGEATLAEHIATIPMSVFIHGYGYNAIDAETYKNTYYPFYKKIRDKNPDLPIVMMSSPVCPEIKTDANAKRMIEYREIVIKAYEKAVSEGDENVYFVDGFTLLADCDATEATVDGTHPTDLGFYSMAKVLYPLLEEILY